MTASRSLRILAELTSPSSLRIARELGLLRQTAPTVEGAREFRELLERLGTTFVKLGQLLASRPDLVGELYTAELEKLHDDVATLPRGEVERIVERSLDFPIDQIFSRFDPEPLAAASIAQVHAAVRRDTLEEVVVKVRRPDIAAQVEEDLSVLAGLAERIDKHVDAARTLQVRSIIDELSWSLRSELDLRTDANNGVLLARILREQDLVRVPRVHTDLVTRDVLVMERMDGVRADDDQVTLLPHETRELLARGLIRAFVRQMLVEGFYHADPHAGNVLVRPAEGDLVLLDFGLVGKLDENTRFEFCMSLLAMAQNRAADMADALVRMSHTTVASDRQRFEQELRRRLPRYHHTSLGQINVGAAIVEIQSVALECGLGLPTPFALIGKALAQVDAIARELDPELDALAEIRSLSLDVLAAQAHQLRHPSAMLSTLAPRVVPLLDLPRRAERLLDGLERGNVSVGITPHLDEAVGELRTIVNRLSAAIVIAASAIASALLMNVRGVGEIAGYPALGLIGFVLSFLATTVIIVRMLRTEGGI